MLIALLAAVLCGYAMQAMTPSMSGTTPSRNVSTKVLWVIGRSFHIDDINEGAWGR